MLSIIVAKASNNAIGLDNKLLWHISEDLKRFKNITSGHNILMGRKTFESLPGILPNRHHYILTRDKSFSIDSEKVTVLYSIEQCVALFQNSSEETFVIGGGEIYNLLSPYCSKMYITNIKKDFEADTFFPQIDYSKWQTIHISGELADEKSGLIFEFVDLEKR
ncbi:MAG: dihydrofolate reductase [Clostridium sp.]|uniref:dihydrofolate reductase n=1 Tax=Clostridium sp. TaxID=1506 RepID=UPI003EE6249A